MLKSELEENLQLCQQANNDLKEELRIAKEEIGATNKELLSERTEVRRLKKLLNTTDTLISSRLDVLRPEFYFEFERGAMTTIVPESVSKMESVKTFLSEEQKFLFSFQKAVTDHIYQNESVMNKPFNRNFY